MRLPGLKSLQVFDVVGRHLNIRRAAEELGLDHSVVSRHLRALQDELGLRLVETSRAGVTLTAAGRDYPTTRSRSAPRAAPSCSGAPSCTGA